MSSDRAPEERAHTGWSIVVARAFGIPIRVHFTFLLLLVIYGAYASRSGDDVALAIAFLLIAFTSVVLHELGHALMARRVGVRTLEIVLYPIGGLARLERMPVGLGELRIALAGPAVNVALALAVGLVIAAAGLPALPAPRLETPVDLVARALWINIALFAFNLVPAFPMDGGRVLRALLSLRMPAERATEIAAAVGQAVAVLFGAWGIVSGNIILMFIALFVFIGAGQESFFFRQLAFVRGRDVRSAMITSFDVLSPEDSLGRAAELLLATHQQDFPVVDAWQRVAGVLPRAALMRGLAEHGPATAVLEVMERDAPQLAPEDELERALELLRGRPSCPVIVVEDERIRGMVTLENLAEFIEISRRSALAR